MDIISGFVLLATATLAVIGFTGAAAVLFGTDSRPTIGDDHAR